MTPTESPDGDSARAQPLLHLRLFGGFEARSGETPLDLHVRKADRLLAYLILRGGRAERADIAAQLWPESESNPLDHSLRALRERLGPEAGRLNATHSLITFSLERASCDVVDFDRRAFADDEETQSKAADGYTGRLLPHWYEPGDAYLEKERLRREEQFRGLLWQLALSARRRGDSETATRYLRRYVAEFPREERGWQDLIRALLEAGERMEAAAQYIEYRDALHRHELRPPPRMEKMYRELMETRKDKNETGDPAETARAGGAMPPDAPHYIVRDADERFRRAIHRSESIVLIKGPRETGKSSLLARGLHTARNAGTLTLLTDFQAMARDDFESIEILCRSLIARLAEQLDSDAAPDALYKPQFSPMTNLERFIQRRLLAVYAQPIVWALDRVDRLFDSPCGLDLFSLLRSWHDRRAYPQFAAWQRLTVVVACANEARLYIPDLNQSPFNVGVLLELSDFGPEQAEALNVRYGCPLESAAANNALYDLLAGHPYLTGRALELLASRSLSLPELIERADQDDGPFGGHLRRLCDGIADDSALRGAVESVLKNRPCPENLFYRLRSAGVLSGPASDAPRIRCALYSRYFRAHWRV